MVMGHPGIFGATVFFTAHIIALIVSVAIYLINGIGFYKIGRIRGIQAPWLAFIPVFNLYTIGIIGDDLKYTDPKINRYFEKVNLALILPLFFLLFHVFTFGAFSTLGELILFALQLMVNYLVFQFYDNDNKVLFTILSVIPVVPAILMLYVTRNIKINN